MGPHVVVNGDDDQFVGEFQGHRGLGEGPGIAGGIGQGLLNEPVNSQFRTRRQGVGRLAGAGETHRQPGQLHGGNQFGQIGQGGLGREIQVVRFPQHAQEFAHFGKR